MKRFALAACLALMISLSVRAGEIPGTVVAPPPPPPNSMASTSSSTTMATVLLTLLAVIR